MTSKELRLRSESILITGGAGFIGSHLVSSLVDSGSKVKIIDNISTGSIKNIAPNLDDGRASLVKSDIIDKQRVKEALKDIEVVYHLAAVTSVPYSIEHPAITKRVNVEGTRLLLEASVHTGVGCFINVSSCAVYGDPKYSPIDEQHPVSPMSPYAESKLMAEKLCTEFQEKRGLKTVTLRLFNVYGPRQVPNEYGGVISQFINSIRERKRPMIFGDGLQTRDFVHVSDAVQALVLASSKKDAINETFNIGSGKPTTINELCRLLIGKLNATLEPLHGKPKIGDIKHSCANIEKARRLLQYEPMVSLEKGLSDLIKR